MSCGGPIIKKEADEAAVIKSLCSLIERKAAAALKDPGATFNLGLSGGSLAKFLVAGLPRIETDWVIKYKKMCQIVIKTFFIIFILPIIGGFLTRPGGDSSSAMSASSPKSRPIAPGASTRPACCR